MKRDSVDSSNIHSVGCDETGLEVQFHRAGCARGTKPPKGETLQAACNCPGGAIWHYPMERELAATHHVQMLGVSAGAHFHRHVKSAKHPTTGLPMFPGVDVTPEPAA